jgi:hypothetical protein
MLGRRLHSPMTTPDDPIGLCRNCVHSRQVPSRTSLFWRCALAETDARFARYPRLPVLRCAGYAAAHEPREDPDDGTR